MSTPRFTKAKAWIGRDLTIHIGGGDRKIRDNEILTGPQWAKFVGMGFLTQLKDETPKKAATQAAADADPPPPAPAEPTPPANEGSVTKSSAGKVAAATGKGKGKGGKGKGKNEPESGGEQTPETSDPVSTEEQSDGAQAEGEAKAATEGATEDGQKDAPPQE